jgi:hypothetical protein
VLAALEHYYNVELTYTSNAIEGNTLTRVDLDCDREGHHGKQQAS